ncbi:MAG: 2-amino-4-hydroxy-6-hydroxymethyldihydropteridine diphosphokinase [Planctomycetota bacterium]
MATAYLGLGSNLGDRAGMLLLALSRLQSVPDVAITAISSIYESDAVDSPANAGPFYNLVVTVETVLGPRDVLHVCRSIEDDLGRVRPAGVINAARLIDIDIIAVDDLVVNEPGLRVPHPRMLARPFVLRPLSEIAPDWRHPEVNVSPSEILEGVSFDKDAKRVVPSFDELPDQPSFEGWLPKVDVVAGGFALLWSIPAIWLVMVMAYEWATHLQRSKSDMAVLVIMPLMTLTLALAIYAVFRMFIRCLQHRFGPPPGPYRRRRRTGGFPVLSKGHK